MVPLRFSADEFRQTGIDDIKRFKTIEPQTSFPVEDILEMLEVLGIRVGRKSLSLFFGTR